MKLNKIIILILVIFIKTGNVLSQDFIEDEAIMRYLNALLEDLANHTD